MKVLILANGGVIHTIKWVNGLLARGVEIILFSLNDFDRTVYPHQENLSIYTLDFNDAKYFIHEGAFNKIKYFKAVPKIKKIIQKHQPDIVHAHYCSSYGSIGALLNFHPYFISVWGSDVYDFPQHNPLFAKLLKFVFKKADYILSTSHVMAKETAKYTDKKIAITPFGVDLKRFKKLKTNQNSNEIVIGTIKKLEFKYGMDTLIESFDLLCKKLNTLPLKLEIVGIGPDQEALEKMVAQKKLQDKVKFVGFINNNEVPQYLNRFDVYVALSRLDSESFGVAVVEAMACETPVVVSNVDGFSEVVINHECGFIVPKENPEAAAEKIAELLNNKTLAATLSQNALQRVKELYNWEDNLTLMQELYSDALKQKNN